MKPTYRFGLFELDADNAELRRDGQVVKLPPQPFRALQILVESGGALVTRQELRRALWGDETFVDCNARLNFCLAQLRSALNDDAGKPSYVSTVPRRGYRFVAAVEVVPRIGSPSVPLTGSSRMPSSGNSWGHARWMRLALVALVVVSVLSIGGILVMASRELAARPESLSLQAIALYERGALALADASPEELRVRGAHFNDAVSADPGYARAYAGIAETQLMLADYRTALPQEAYAAAKAAAARALQLDPRLGEAHASYAAAVLYFEWDWKTAGEHFGQALKYAPSNPTVLARYSRYLAASGQFDLARAMAVRAVALAPASVSVRTTLGRVLFYAGRHDEAVAECQKALDVMPGFTPARLCAQAAAAQAASPDAAMPYWRSRVERITAEGCDQQPMAAAIAYAHVGDVDAALRWLERAAELHTDALVYARVHPGLAPLHHTPRYARVLDRVGGPR